MNKEKKCAFLESTCKILSSEKFINERKSAITDKANFGNKKIILVFQNSTLLKIRVDKQLFEPGWCVSEIDCNISIPT